MPSTIRNTALLSLLSLATASPLPTHLMKRHMTAGAQAGLGIGIAVAVVIVILVITFFFIHQRRKNHNAVMEQERAVLAGEKYPDGRDKPDKFASEPQISAMPRRNKSVKDRLMGPLYRGSMIEMPQMPNRAKIGTNSNRASTFTLGNRDSWLNKPWSDEHSNRPSFSSKRATRMMMMM